MTGEVQINRTNKWIFINRDSYYVVDDQDYRLPHIGSEAAKVVHRDREKEFEAKVKLASPRRQHRAMKELSSRRGVRIPFQFQMGMDPDDRGNHDREVLQETRESIRQILESRIVSSIPSKSRQTNIDSLSISPKNATQSNDEAEGVFPQKTICPSHRSTALFTGQKSGCDNNEELGEELSCNSARKFNESENSQDHDVLEKETKDSSIRNQISSPDYDQAVSYEASDAVSIVTSRPTSSLSIPSLPESEHNSGIESDFNSLVNAVTSMSSVSLGQCQGQSQRGGRSSGTPERPKWPSLIDVQRLKSGGFRYRPSTSKSTYVSGPPQVTDPTSGQHAHHEDAIAETRTPVKKRGTIIVPSHTTLDCPLCNLYSDEHPGTHERNSSVYQRTNQPKKTVKQGMLKTRRTIPEPKPIGARSMATGCHSAMIAINRVASKQAEMARYRSENSLPESRPKSAIVLQINRNQFANQGTQIPTLSCNNLKPFRLSYVKAPSR